MKILKVIPVKRWFNKITLQTASMHGSVPWTSNAEKMEWELVTVGFTWRLDNGTIGLGRVPAKTLSEANQIMEEFNNRV